MAVEVDAVPRREPPRRQRVSRTPALTVKPANRVSVAPDGALRTLRAVFAKPGPLQIVEDGEQKPSDGLHK